MRTLLALSLLTLVACGDKEDDTASAAEACPVGVELTGPELPCDCAGEEVSGLPGDGSVCSCTEDGFECEGGVGTDGTDGSDGSDGSDGTSGYPDCPYAELTGPELPCDCEGDLVEGLPGNGAYCYCREGEGFVCEDAEWPDT